MRCFAVLMFMSAAALAQMPRVGTLDFFGVHKVPEARLRQALGTREGEPLPASKGDAEERLDKVSGVVESHLEAVCCESGKVILYVGIEERGAAHFDLREPPDGEETLPQEITDTYRRFLEAFEDASRRGVTDEDLTQGHSRMADLRARAIQDMFPALARTHMNELRSVLHNSEDEEQRAIAAYVIGYSPEKGSIVNDLQFALKDADSGVRVNAVRNLMALSVLERLHPDSGVRVEPTWFVEMLHSLSWTDRTRAMGALQILTDKRDPAVLDLLRERALPDLVEMARWKTLAHALPAYILLGRIAGIPDQQIQDAWSRGDREFVISAVNKPRR